MSFCPTFREREASWSLVGVRFRWSSELSSRAAAFSAAARAALALTAGSAVEAAEGVGVVVGGARVVPGGGGVRPKTARLGEEGVVLGWL